MPKLRDHTTIDSRVYARQRSKTKTTSPRYYGDFRDYADVGGALEPLIMTGCRYATTDEEEAAKLAQARLDELEEKRAKRPVGPAEKRVLEVIIGDHLKRKAKLGEGGEGWLGNVQVHLETFESFFGVERDLADIELKEIEDYRAHLFTLPNGRGGTLSTGSIAQYLNSASNLYERAIKDQLLDPGKNLVALLPPLEINRAKTPFLEVDEMADVLRFAFEEYEPTREDLAIPFVAVILALMALAGLREKEALGLLRSDVDLRRRIIHVRPNHFRPRLKTKTSKRVAPIFTQLLEILRAYLSGPWAPTGQLLLPSPFGGEEESMITELRKAYDKMPMPERLRRQMTEAEHAKAEELHINKLGRAQGKRRGPKPKESLEELLKPIPETQTIIPPLRSKILRHTYTTARVQNTDRGKPISLWTVAQELGHANTDMLQKVYAHLGKVRHRGEEVEYRW